MRAVVRESPNPAARALDDVPAILSDLHRRLFQRASQPSSQLRYACARPLDLDRPDPQCALEPIGQLIASLHRLEQSRPRLRERIRLRQLADARLRVLDPVGHFARQPVA